MGYNAIHLAMKDWCFHTFWTLLEGKRLFEVRNREREKALGVFDVLEALCAGARARRPITEQKIGVSNHTTKLAAGARSAVLLVIQY